MQNSVLLLLGLMVLTAIIIACWPLYKIRKKTIWLIIPCCLSVVFAYLQWGGYFSLLDYQQKLKKEREINEILTSHTKTKALITRIISQLDKSPRSAQGWFLVGKLYLVQKQYDEAEQAFSCAHELKPEDVQISLYLVQSIYQGHQQQLNKKARFILGEILKKYPYQPEALALAAQDAFQMKEFTNAIKYWQKLLTQLPKDSEETAAIIRAVEKAKLLQSNPG